jgi:signal peptidase I
MADEFPAHDPTSGAFGIQSGAPTDGERLDPSGKINADGGEFNLVAYRNELLLWLRNLVLGGAVGAVAGLLIYFILALLGFQHSSRTALMVWSGAGLLLGLFFNHVLLRMLGLLPKTQPKPVVKTWGKVAASQQTDGFREVIETIVFVVVLVLLLRSFAAEAFVIPTGSMAETLYGYQKLIECPQCKYEFPVNCASEVEGQRDPRTGKQVRSFVGSCTCPNCRQHIRLVPSSNSEFFHGDPPDNGADSIRDPGWSSGDRVLVAKFLYELFQAQPDRLDVVVFKFPGDGQEGDFPVSGPVANGVPMNYIKRLIGLPGETIVIHNGELYVLAPDPDRTKAYAKEDESVKKELLWQKSHMHRDDKEVIELFKEYLKAPGDHPRFTIVRKSPDNILAMMRIVYDDDHPAKDLIGVQPPRWTGRDKDSGWTPGKDNDFSLASTTDDRAHWLGYQHILREPDDRKKRLITDFMGYNSSDDRRDLQGKNWVGDLILECEAQVDKQQGELTLELSKGPDRFQARFDLANGRCKLNRVGPDGKEEQLASGPTEMKGAGTHKLRFANVDQRLLLWVDESLPVNLGPVQYDPRKEEGPTANDLEPASIGVKGVGVAVRHLKLFRDTYYTANPSSPDVNLPSDAYSDPSHWKPFSELPISTLYVQPGHYLCMGDNSPASSDSRVWGLVPQRLLLGKALMVYYPFTRFGPIH